MGNFRMKRSVLPIEAGGEWRTQEVNAARTNPGFKGNMREIINSRHANKRMNDREELKDGRKRNEKEGERAILYEFGCQRK